MKNILLFGLLLFFAKMATAQKKDSSIKEVTIAAAYISIGGGTGFIYNDHTTYLWINTEVIFKKGLGVGYNFIMGGPVSKKLPADYKPGLSFSMYRNPHDVHKSYALTFVKNIFLRKNNLVRFALEAGPSVNTYNEKSFVPTPISYNGGWFSSSWLAPNYKVESNITTTIGLFTKASIEFPLLPFCGLNIGAFGNLASYNTAYGIDCSLSFGKVRGRKRRR